jgi:hypothetical protein
MNAVAVCAIIKRSYQLTDFRVVPIRGHAVSYSSKYMVHLDHRSARLDLGPCPPQDDISFAINERGFKDVADD